MNINLCKKCHLYPNLFILKNFEGNNTVKTICCMNRYQSYPLTVAELNDDNFNKIIDYLIENNYYEKYNTVSSEMIGLVNRINNSEILKNIEVNKYCPYYFEHEMDRLNE